ncbi:MAG: DNRLRE domain-containing protein, partial [Acidimicrobiales bacterium]
MAAAVMASGLAVAAAAPPQEEPAQEPFAMERVGEAQNVRELDPLDSGQDRPVERVLETGEELGDFSNPPLQGEELAQAEYDLAADLAAGRVEKDQSFDPRTSDKVASATTAQAEVFDNGNGTRTAVLGAGPERFKDATGDWVDFDLTPKASADGSYRATASDLDVSVPADPEADGLVVMSRAEEMVGFGVPSVLVAGFSAPRAESDALSPDGHVAVKDSAGTTAAITLTTSGFEQQVTVGSRAALQKDGYELTVSLPEGWAVRQGDAGTNRVEFFNIAGELVATFGSGVAWDSTGASLALAQMSDAVIVLDRTDAGQAVVRVSVDGAWLDKAVFPVTIDPTFTYTITGDSTYADTFAQNDLGTAQENALFVAAGSKTGGPSFSGTYMRFPLPAAVTGAPTPPDVLAGVVSAELKLRVYSYAACNAAPLYVQSIAGAWTPSTMTYASGMPTAHEVFPTASATMSNTGCTEAWYSFFPRASLQAQYAGTIGNHGLMITPWLDTTADSRRLARSAEYGSNAAQLIVTYEWRPPTPTTIIGPADDATVTTTRPTLSVGAVT